MSSARPTCLDEKQLWERMEALAARLSDIMMCTKAEGFALLQSRNWQPDAILSIDFDRSRLHAGLVDAEGHTAATAAVPWGHNYIAAITLQAISV